MKRSSEGNSTSGGECLLIASSWSSGAWPWGLQTGPPWNRSLTTPGWGRQLRHLNPTRVRFGLGPSARNRPQAQVLARRAFEKDWGGGNGLNWAQWKILDLMGFSQQGIVCLVFSFFFREIIIYYLSFLPYSLIFFSDWGQFFLLFGVSLTSSYLLLLFFVTKLVYAVGNAPI